MGLHLWTQYDSDGGARGLQAANWGNYSGVRAAAPVRAGGGGGGEQPGALTGYGITCDAYFPPARSISRRAHIN